MGKRIFYWNAFCVEVGIEPELWFSFHPNASLIFTLDALNARFVSQSILLAHAGVFRANLFDDKENSLWVGFRKPKSKYNRVPVYYFGVGDSSNVVEAFMLADDSYDKWKNSFEFEDSLSTAEGRKRIDELESKKYSNIQYASPLMLPARATMKMARTILNYLDGKRQDLPVTESEWV